MAWKIDTLILDQTTGGAVVRATHTDEQHVERVYPYPDVPIGTPNDRKEFLQRLWRDHQTRLEMESKSKVVIDTNAVEVLLDEGSKTLAIVEADPRKTVQEALDIVRTDKALEA